MNRRDMLKMLGIGATFSSLRAADPPKFPQGPVIRTILKDVPPESLSSGATLFHEHMSLAPDFMPRWMAASARTRGATPPAIQAQPQPFFMEDLELMVSEMKAAQADGVACLVD